MLRATIVNTSADNAAPVVAARHTTRTGETFGSCCTRTSPGRPPVLELPIWFEVGSFVVLTLILIADLLLVALDPRIRLGGKAE